MRARLRRGVERHPLLGWALLAAAAVVFADGARWLGAIGLVVVLVGMAVAGKWRLLAAGSVLAVLAGLLHAARIDSQRAREAAIGEGRWGELDGRVIGEPRKYERSWSAEVGSETHGRVMSRGAGEAPARGQGIRAAGRFTPLSEPRNPGEFDVRGWLWRRGVSSEFRAEGDVTATGPPPWWVSGGESLRAGFREAVTRGLDPDCEEAAVIRAVVLGERPEDDGLLEPFRLSGTLHIFAVSGLHVGMMGVLGWLLLKCLGVPRRAAVLLLVALVFFYAWMTGLKPPAVRAAWMATVVLGAFWFRRRPDVANALGLAGLIVVFHDGHQIFRAGVQLSFGVVAAIGLLGRVVAPAFAWIKREEPYLPRSLYGRWRTGWLSTRRGVADSLGVSTAATLGSGPLTAFYFGLWTPMSILASAVLVWVVFPLLALALVSAVLSPLPAVSGWVNRVNGGLARAVLKVAEVASAVPGGSHAVARDRPPGDFLVVYDLGKNGAACLHDGGAALLIDAGGRFDFERSVLPSLERMALRPSAMVLSHPDGGHVGGAIAALDEFPVRQVLVPVLQGRGTNFREMAVAAGRRGVPLIRGRTGVFYPISETAGLRVMLEPDPWSWSTSADERVMPVRLDWHGWRILFVADAGRQVERKLMDAGGDLRADVIVAGRNLHDSSLGLDFLARVAPQAIVAGHGDFPAAEQVPEAWRSACEARGIRVFHQGECGAVILTATAGSLEVRGFLGGGLLFMER